MANNYKNAAVVLTSTGATDLYTCPSGRTAIVQSVNVANVDSSNRDVTVTLYDSSVATSYTVIYNATIPVGVSMNALSTPLVLEPGDIVRVQASAANTLHATASVLEQDATAIQVDGSITTAKIADDAVTQAKLASMLTTTLPTSPTVGEVIIYEANAANGVMWMLVYDGVGSYPWKFVGGGSLFAQWTAGFSTSSTSFTTDTNFTGFSIPLAGDYVVTSTALGQNNTAFQWWLWRPDGCSYPTSDSSGVRVSQGNNGNYESGTRSLRATLTTGTLNAKMRVVGATGTVVDRSITATPVRVG